MRLAHCIAGFVFLAGLCPATVLRAVSFYHADIVVYGDSPSAVTAAIELAGSRHDVLLVSPSMHVGGMMVEGLGYQDTDSRSGNGAPIGGLAREFYLRVAKVYTPSSTTPRYAFEAKVAEAVIDAWLVEKGVRQLRGRRLSEAPNAIRKNGTRITELTLDDGTRVAGRVFVDGTVEGDLMAFAGVTYTWGREGNAQYGETINGIINPTTANQYAVNVDPYVTPGVPSSGVLTGVQNEPVGVNGTGDLASMGYCFRLPLTKNPANKISITAPPGYQVATYELYRRYLAAGGMNDWLDGPGPIDASTTTKVFDLGSWHDLSANLYGRNHAYPDGTYAQRQQIYNEHKNFTQGLIYYLSTDPAVPASVRNEWSRWGLCADEFTDNGGWPRRLYVRAARRMVSDYVITEADVRATAIGSLVPRPAAADPVGLSYWPPDLHNARTVIRNGKVYNEGATFDLGNYRPFGIAFRALVPRRAECTNLIVPSALSSSYVGYGAVRLEWTFMVLGQSAGIAAAWALDRDADVQDVAYASLQPLLIAGGQVLSLDGTATGPEVIVDNTDAGVTLAGTWTPSTFYSGYYGTNYLHDGDTGKGTKSIRFTPTLPSAGTYRVYARWSADSTRSAAVPVDVAHAAGLAAVSVNQQQNSNTWNLLGTWPFNAGTGGYVLIRNTNTTGYVIADAVRFVRVGGLPQVSIAAASARTDEGSATAGLLKVTRSGDLSASLTVNLAIAGTATAGVDYAALPSTLTFAAGAGVVSLNVQTLADGLIEGNETVIVSLAAGDGYTQGAAASATVQVVDKAFDGWRYARFSPAETANPLVSAATADPDGNGVPNLLEFAFGAEPDVAFAGPPCEMNYRADGANVTMELTAWRRRDLGGYVVTPQISTDLQFWTTVGNEGVVLDYDAARDRLRILYAIPVPEAASRFFARLQVRPAGSQ